MGKSRNTYDKISEITNKSLKGIRSGAENAVKSVWKAAADSLYPTDWTVWNKPFAPKHSKFGKTNTAHSGCDITPTIFTGRTLYVLGNIHTLSYSIHREKGHVRSLGRMYSKGYTRGPATIAGSLIFSVFDRHVLYDILGEYQYEPSTEQNPSINGTNMRSPLSVELPPFDISILFTNEYGYLSYLKIYGVEIVDEGQTMSVDDVVTENMMQYVARDIDPMMPFEAGSPSGRSIAFNKAVFTDRTPLINYAHNRTKVLDAYKNAERYIQNLIALEREEIAKDSEFGSTEDRDYLEEGLLKIQKGGIPNAFTKQKLIEKGIWIDLKKQENNEEALIGLNTAQSEYDRGFQGEVKETYQRGQYDPNVIYSKKVY